jgi:hypothetical protein
MIWDLVIIGGGPVGRIFISKKQYKNPYIRRT